ncbi:MAG: cation diffusion facilitator family transporter [Nitrososphaerota archaeon]
MQPVIHRTIYIVLTMNIIAAITLVVGGALTKSLAVTVGGLESGINILSLSFLLYFIKKSNLPPDADHPYGHHKYENVSAIVTSVFMSSAGVMILYSSIERISSPVEIKGEALYFAILSLILPLLSYLVLLWTAKKTKAISIYAETRHLLVDATDSIIILAGVVLAIKSNPIFDSLSALIVGIVFIYGIITNIKTSLPSLIDEGLPNEYIEEIKGISLTVSGVKDSHTVRSRKTPKGYFIDMHLSLEPTTTLGKAHEIAHEVERKVKQSIKKFVIADLVIHIEPYLLDRHEESNN